MDFLGPGGHYGAGGRVGPMVRVGMGVRSVMGRERRATGRSTGSSGSITGISGGSCRGVTIGRLTHLRARAQVSVTALHLTGGQSAAGGLEAGRCCGRSLIQIRVVHNAVAWLQVNPLCVTPMALSTLMALSTVVSLHFGDNN